MDLRMTKVDINKLLIAAAEAGGKAGAEVYKRERDKADDRKRKEEDKGEVTKKRLKDYRAVKKRLGSKKGKKLDLYSKEEVDELTFRYFEDLMETPKGVSTRVEDQYERDLVKLLFDKKEIEEMEEAFRNYEDSCKAYGKEESVRRCQELYMMYMADKEYSVGEIAGEMHVSEKTVYKDITIACRVFSSYLHGF